MLTPQHDRGNPWHPTGDDDPEPLPPTPTCPNAQWTLDIVDVAFTEATLTLLEDGVVSDVVTVPVTS